MFLLPPYCSLVSAVIGIYAGCLGLVTLNMAENTCWFWWASYQGQPPCPSQILYHFHSITTSRTSQLATTCLSKILYPSPVHPSQHLLEDKHRDQAWCPTSFVVSIIHPTQRRIWGSGLHCSICTFTKGAEYCLDIICVMCCAWPKSHVCTSLDTQMGWTSSEAFILPLSRGVGVAPGCNNTLQVGYPQKCN